MITSFPFHRAHIVESKNKKDDLDIESYRSVHIFIYIILKITVLHEIYHSEAAAPSLSFIGRCSEIMYIACLTFPRLSYISGKGCHECSLCAAALHVQTDDGGFIRHFASLSPFIRRRRRPVIGKHPLVIRMLSRKRTIHCKNSSQISPAPMKQPSVRSFECAVSNGSFLSRLNLTNLMYEIQQIRRSSLTRA